MDKCPLEPTLHRWCIMPKGDERMIAEPSHGTHYLAAATMVAFSQSDPSDWK